MNAALDRALSQADYVILDGWCPQWQFEAVHEAEAAGQVSIEEQRGSQYTALIVRKINA